MQKHAQTETRHKVCLSFLPMDFPRFGVDVELIAETTKRAGPGIHGRNFWTEPPVPLRYRNKYKHKCLNNQKGVPEKDHQLIMCFCLVRTQLAYVHHHPPTTTRSRQAAMAAVLRLSTRPSWARPAKSRPSRSTLLWSPRGSRR